MDGWIVGHGVWVIVGENDYLPLRLIIECCTSLYMRFFRANNHLPLRIIAIDQIDDDFHHGVFFLGFALGNQQGKRW